MQYSIMQYSINIVLLLNKYINKYIKRLKTWKSGHGDYITFTERDTQKRKDTKDNDLNFIELWNLKFKRLKEAYDFVYKLKEKLLK